MQSLWKTVSSSPCTVLNLLLGAFTAQDGEQTDAKDVKVPPPYGYEQGRPGEILTATACVFNEQKHLRNLFYSSKR